MKTYVVDTNVLIQAPHALMSFEDNANDESERSALALDASCRM